MFGVKPKSGRLATFAAAVLAAMLVSSTAWADGKHPKKVDGTNAQGAGLTEPFFTKRSFAEKEIEFVTRFTMFNPKRVWNFGAGATWVFFERLQFGIEIPLAMVTTKGADTKSKLGDVEFSTKLVLTPPEQKGFVVSVNGQIAPPTGSRANGIGGTGEWGVSLTVGAAIPLSGALIPRIDVHGQLGYEQQLRPSAEAKEEAAEMGIRSKREKELIWRVAISAPLQGGTFVPVFEVIGTRILDATNPAEQGNIVEIGGGLWVTPFAGMTGNALAPLVVGVAAKTTVTKRREGNYSVLFVVRFPLGGGPH